MSPHYTDPLVTLYLGDCLDVMRELPDASVDSVVTDPPYGLEFMGKEWDRLGDLRQRGDPTFKEGERRHGLVRHGGSASYGVNAAVASRAMQAWHEQWATEAFRVLKPGGYMIAAGGTRTYHRLASAVEDAGFEIRDQLIWCYASGFPKSHNVSEALRKLPACSCDVAGKVGTVDAGLPSGLVRAGVGTEPGAVPLAGLSADEAPGVGAESRPRPGRRSRKVDADTIDLGWELDPVVLGPLDVAGAAEGEQVVGTVGGVEADVEPLGDQVVDDEPIGGPAVGATLVSSEDRVRDDAPASALVAPLAPPPGGVPLTGDADPVVTGHAVSRAIDGLGGGTGNDLTAGSTGEGVTHLPDYTTEDRALRCETCGGIRQDRIPEGMGTALKPAYEPWVLARKPLIGTVAQNFVRYGTGALNIDGTRIKSEGERIARDFSKQKSTTGEQTYGDFPNRPDEGVWENTKGRWPSNVLLSDPELFDEPNPFVVGSGATTTNQSTRTDPAAKAGEMFGGQSSKGSRSPEYLGDSGGYSRFFIIPKADRAERERGLTGVNGARGNSHPTVKPLDLLRHLVRLVTPPGGVVLDPFLGSGTTALAASEEGFRCIGIEREAEYLEIAVGRLMATPMGLGLSHEIVGKAPPKTHPDLSKHQPKRRAPADNWTGGWAGTNEDAYSPNKDVDSEEPAA